MNKFCVLLVFFSSFLRCALTETAFWKIDIQKDFESSINYLKDIINQAESPYQKDLFEKIFIGKTDWLTRSLESIQSADDALFSTLKEHTNNLKKLVSSHQSCEQKLKERLSVGTLQPCNVAAHRLLLLYELADHVQQETINESEIVENTLREIFKPYGDVLEEYHKKIDLHGHDDHVTNSSPSYSEEQNQAGEDEVIVLKIKCNELEGKVSLMEELADRSSHEQNTLYDLSRATTQEQQELIKKSHQAQP